MKYEPSVIITQDGKETALDSLSLEEKREFFRKHTIRAFKELGMRCKEKETKG